MKTLLLILSLLAPIQSLDLAVRDAVQQSRRPELETPMRFLSDKLGKPPVVFGTLLALCVVQGVPGVETARLALATLVPVNLVVEVLKRLTFRTRPDGERNRSNAAFPSSHTANALALAAVIAHRYRRVAVLAWAIAILIAFSRIYLNRHWLSDVIGAALLALGIAWFAISRWERRRRAAELVAEAPP